MDMLSTSVSDAYAAHRPAARIRGVRALLALAPRGGTHAWSGLELAHWIRLTDAVSEEEIEAALALATAWGAGETQQVAVATHIVLVRLAPSGAGEDAARLRSNIDSVCDHLRSRLSGDLAKRLPRTRTSLPELSSAVIWAYFFACLSVLLFAIAVTR
jgi:hypothetical protein